MYKKSKIGKDQPKERWRKIYQALSQLENLNVRPTDWAVAQVQRELVGQLDTIEYQLGQDLRDVYRGLA